MHYQHDWNPKPWQMLLARAVLQYCEMLGKANKISRFEAKNRTAKGVFLDIDWIDWGGAGFFFVVVVVLWTYYTVVEEGGSSTATRLTARVIKVEKSAQ